jgi:hypothetical protein
MKKSEVIKEISLNIARQAITSGNHEIDLTWLDVEKVLDKIEELGMLPPRWYDKYGAYEMYRYTWEPEDEKK